ncbi:hypothetical protein A3K63_02500 [Candidatus Micrarchaeota archaeon RBG_16_49_10]|nr:MAG: hypothetical protein A3K63_02500 [Candidatus Micrarchaeota archaeon RBG_16_49_10]
MLDRRVSAIVRKTNKGLRLEELEGQLYEIDYSDTAPEGERSARVDVLETIEKAMGIIYEQQENPRPYGPRYHGLLITVVSDMYGEGNRLKLAKAIGGRRLTTEAYVEDAESLAKLLTDIATGEAHDGAIIIDDKTGKVVGYHAWLLSFPFDVDGAMMTNNGDGTRKSIAQQYSEWEWVDAAYTMSEGDGCVRKYVKGEITKLRQPYNLN